MRRMFLVHAVIIFFVILIVPADAFAWGPGAHVDIALNVLARLSSAVPFIAELIRRFPEAFIYGAASPDIVVGKKYAGYLNHCHNWRMGWLILHEAEGDRQRAAAYGYLTHLAADVVAHNYYIPVKFIRSYNAKLLTHTYWEMRFDLGVHDEIWNRLKMVTELEIKEFDELLEQVLRKTIFSFSTNKRIFNSILILQKMRGMRSSLKAYAKRSRFDIPVENRQHYMDLALEASFNFLANPEKAASLEIDPRGEARLAYAANLRRRIREMLERGLMTEQQVSRLVDLAKERLAMGLYRPEMILPDVVDVL